MNESRLDGAGVLVTRPEPLARELIDAVTAAGGEALPFPVIDILPRGADAIAADLAAMPAADIAVFVSRNAVAHGLAALTTSPARVAAIGPATAGALAAAGRPADIVPRQGFDSEHLLAEPAFHDVAGKRIRIVRGEDGRELLARTLRERGAAVDYLAVYRRERHRYSADELAAIERLWNEGRIRFLTAMSVASLENLLELLPATCRDRLHRARLVTPSERVIQTALERIPRVRSLLAAGPGATCMVAAMLADRPPHTDNAHD